MNEQYHKTILDISLKMAQTRQLQPLLEYAMQAALELVGAEYGYLILSRPDEGLDFRVSLDARGKTIENPQTQISHTIIQDVLDTNEPLVVLDALEFGSLSEASSVSALELRSVMCVSLRTHQQILGVIYVENRSEAGIFDDEDVEPLRFFAAQAAVMIENALLTEDLEELVAARTQALEISQRDLRKLSRAVEQSGGTIVITDSDGVIEFVNPAFSRTTGYTSQEAIGHPTGILKSGKTPAQVYQDLWGTITQGGTWEGELLNQKKSGELYWESATISPVKDKAGHITHYVAVKEDITARKAAESALQEAHDTLEQHVRARTSELTRANEQLQQEIIQRRQAVAETHQLLDTLEQRVADRTLELAAFFDLTMLASETRSLDDLLSPAAARITAVARCNAVCVHLFSEDRRTMKMATHANLPEAARLQLQEIPLQGRFGRWAKANNKPIVTSQTSREKLLPSVLRLSDCSSYLVAQIHAQDQPLGMLTCFRHSDEGFALDEISLLTALAEQLGIMLENQRLRERVAEIAITAERQRLARELHDSITQSLYSQTLFARTAQYAREDGDQARLVDSLEQIEENALYSLKEMRLLLFHLQPQALEDMGFAAAINARLDMVERRLGIQAACEVDETLNIPVEIEETLYRVALEALNNSLKHARAGQVRVQLKATETDTIMEVNDDGSGFDTSEERGGMGLSIMQERVRQAGGEIEIQSRPDEGTVVRVVI